MPADVVRQLRVFFGCQTEIKNFSFMITVFPGNCRT